MVTHMDSHDPEYGFIQMLWFCVICLPCPTIFIRNDSELTPIGFGRYTVYLLPATHTNKCRHSMAKLSCRLLFTTTTVVYTTHKQCECASLCL